MTPPSGFQRFLQWGKREGLAPLLLSCVTLLALIFLTWEVIEKKFFSGLDFATLHYLYISRGIVTGFLMAAWAAWFVLRNRRSHGEEQRRIQAQLFQAEKLSALGELVSGLAHEINNPLGIMSSRLELMIQEAAAGGAPPRALKDLEVLRAQTSRLTDITRNLLNFARRAPLESAPVNLSAAAENVLRLVEDILKRKRITLIRHLDWNLPPVTGCQNHLEQVILNLVKNAAEALEGHPHPRIWVDTWFSRPDGRVHVRVADNGPGIPFSILDKVFNPFFTTKEKGTGLGLSVSYGIVQQHGGQLLIVGNGPLSPLGTCFLASFPVSAPPPVRAADKPAASAEEVPVHG